MAILETIKENIGTAGQITADIAKRTAETIRLRDQIRRDRKDIRKLTYEIGETYLRLHAEDFDEEYKELIDGIAAAKADIEEKLEKLAQLKAKTEEPEVAEEEFEDEEEEEWDDLFEDGELTLEEGPSGEAEAVEEAVAMAEEAEEAEDLAEAVEE